ncbi:hypothetical protein ACS8E9_16465 [Pseudomonas neustonica]|uniref:hypothetical protein n=1 Tax=Pseudomonas neustonica TaxID=2487346 RepID=UPI003F482FFB
MATVNPWKRFIGLLPGGERTVGTVANINASAGTSTLTLRNGVAVMVQGTNVGVGQKAFVVDGKITGHAPSLPQYDVEV